MVYLGYDLTLVGRVSPLLLQQEGRRYTLRNEPVMASRILVIDDDHDIVDLYRLIFEEAGYEALFAFSAFEEVSAIQQLHPDLILLDAKLGSDNGGLLLLEQLKLHHATQAIPVLLCTAADEVRRQHEESLRDRRIPILAKPFDIENLLHMVQQLLHASLSHVGEGTAAREP
jgi:two-component system response regulator VicR